MERSIRIAMNEAAIKGIFPVELAVEMFDLLLEQEELITKGIRCEKCGELCIPEDLAKGVCRECLFEIAKKDELSRKAKSEYSKKEKEQELEEMLDFADFVDSLLGDLV